MGTERIIQFRAALLRGGLALGALAVSANCVAPRHSDGNAITPQLSENRRAIHANGTEERFVIAARAINDSVVEVIATTASAEESSDAEHEARVVRSILGGCGVIVAHDGFILTAGHLVQTANAVHVKLPDGGQFTVDRVAVHPTLDLAVLRIKAKSLPSISIARNPVSIGDPVAALRSTPEGQQCILRTGHVISRNLALQSVWPKQTTFSYASMIESSTVLDFGFSGGPLINTDGQLVGINVAASGQPTNLSARGYALPVHDRAHVAIEAICQQLRH